MKVSYVLMIIGLFLWDWGMILFISVFTLGIPLVILALPLLGLTMVYAKSMISLLLRLFCSLLSVIPLRITLASLPLRTMTSENGDYIVTPHGSVIALVIIASGILFLVATICVFLEQNRLLQEKDAHF